MKTKHVGGVQTSETGAGALQKADYLYNIRGWLRKLNEPAVLGTDLFSYELKYNTALSSGVPAGVQPLFNGNIAEASWKTSSDNQLRNYFYEYDGLNRLKSASSKAGMTLGGYNENGITYDKNGNILTLNRTGINPLSNLSTAIDGLSYRYDTGNKLLAVTDAQLKNEGFTEPENQTGNDYTYDSFGNMMTNANKNITSIKYNHLNLPREIAINDVVVGSNGVPTAYASKISYLYRADGIKLQKNVYRRNHSLNIFVNQITDYLTGFQYDNMNSRNGAYQLRFFPHKEGYVNNKLFGYESSPTFNLEYVYNHTDHLGNIRLSYKKNGTTTQILEENNYYPFGLKHKGYNDNNYSNGYKYKYNGKELQDELNLNVYDFSARVFDPASVVAWQHDPLSEQTLTPYSLFYGNPVYYNDPTGMKPNDWFWNSSTQRVEWRDSSANELKEGNNTLVNVGKNKSEVMQTFGIPRGASINEDDTSFTLNFEEKTMYNLKGSELTKGGFIIPQGSHDGKISLSYTNELTTKREDGVTFINGVKTTVRQTYHYNDQAGKISDKSLFYSEYQTFNNTTQSASKVFSKKGLDLTPSINNFHGENFHPLNFQSFSTTTPFSKDFKNENITIRATMGATDGNKSFRITNYLRINK